MTLREPPPPFAYEGLDRVIHERARLGILTSLVAHPKGIVFGNLKQMCGLTDGNLSRHLDVLEEEGMVEIVKSFPKTGPRPCAGSRGAGVDATSNISRCSKGSSATRAAR